MLELLVALTLSDSFLVKDRDLEATVLEFEVVPFPSPLVLLLLFVNPEALLLLSLSKCMDRKPPFHTFNVYLKPVNDLSSIGFLVHLRTGVPVLSSALSAKSPVVREDPVPPLPPAAIEVGTPEPVLVLLLFVVLELELVLLLPFIEGLCALEETVLSSEPRFLFPLAALFVGDLRACFLTLDTKLFEGDAGADGDAMAEAAVDCAAEVLEAGIDDGTAKDTEEDCADAGIEDEIVERRLGDSFSVTNR